MDNYESKIIQKGTAGGVGIAASGGEKPAEKSSKFKIMVIRSSRTFMVNSMITNLEGIGCLVYEVGFDVKEISVYQDEVDLMLLYSDRDIGEYLSALIYLKDLCMEKSKQLLVIGSREELDEITENIPEHLLVDAIERPLDMNALVEKINSLKTEEVIEQRKKSILVVDDDASYVQLLREWLKNDYRVGMARSGVQAITWLARNHVDLILLDYEMPITNGLQVFEMLRSEQFSKDIPIMFLTGKSDKDTIMKVMALKPAGYMLKNVTRFQLLAYLQNYFVKENYSKS